MNIKLLSKNLEITPAMEAMLTKKLSKLDRFFPADTQATAFLTTVKDQARLEITVPVRGSLIRCDTKGPDMYQLMDEAADSIEKQLKRYRSKLKEHGREGLILDELPEAPDEPEPIRIVKTKRFAIKPMDPEEACLEMELLGHDFYMFLNSETEEVNVVYRRKGGCYGLIEPILDDEED